MYQRGKYSYGVQRKKTIEERFWEKVDRRGEDECWEWLGARASASKKRNFLGYGVINIHRVLTLTHRYSFELRNGYIDPDLLVCHECDNGLCVNPKHLWQGTAWENTQDMIYKGRQSRVKNQHLRKQKRPYKRLTLPQVKEIRRLRAEDKKRYKIRVLAEMFGVSMPSIFFVISNHSWKDA